MTFDANIINNRYQIVVNEERVLLGKPITLSENILVLYFREGNANSIFTKVNAYQNT